MKISNIIIGIIIALTLSSCGAEFELAKKFVNQSNQINVAVYFPEDAQVTLIQDEEGAYTQALDSLNQNVFLDVMYAAYADELKSYRLNVYVPEDPNNIQTDSIHWLVILSKVEIQGLFTEYVDHLYDFFDEYDYTFSLNTVNVASWFDVNDGDWHPTLFDEYNLTDDFNSYVTRDGKGGSQYHYNITPIKADDVYDYAVFLGKRYAACTYDYMMNSYVESAMKAKNRWPRFKLNWDPRQSSYYFQEDGEGFIELKDEN